MKEKVITRIQRPISTIQVPNNNPTNSFINWLDDKYLNHDITFNVEYSDREKVSDFITISDIDTWKNSEPVFISSQMGSGKNHFIKKILVNSILENNISNSNKKSILILSNRIALNRQSKLEYADLIFKATGDRDVYTKLEELYSFKGFDKFYMDFNDCITICSYHQLLDRKILDLREYTYIVCDEAHFFIQDSIFNKYTDDMLRYIVDKGKNSIRIYMSATLNLVMEPILREEYKKIEKANIDYKKLYINDMDSFIRSKTKISMIVRIYYMKRNYSFIKNIYQFDTLDELIGTINNSKMKWLVFVKSKSDGEYIEKHITKRNRVFLSRERIDNDAKIEQIYNDIVEKQYYTQEVLITTSVLDNGINLLPDKDHHPIRNIVLFSLDKSQFLQMLGRIRTIKDKSLNIFLFNYSKESIKYYLDRTIDDLIGRLQCDLWDDEEKRRNYNEKYYKMVDGKRLYDYNDYSIMKLLDNGKRLSDLYVMNNMENKVGNLHCSNRDLESSRNQLIFKLKTIWKDIHMFSGSVYNLLEECNKILDTYFDFESYFYGKILQDVFYKKIKNRINMLMRLLPLLKQNQIINKLLLYNEMNRMYRLQYQIKLIVEELEKEGLIIAFKEYEYFGLCESYKMLSVSVCNENSLKEQCSWLSTVADNGREYSFEYKIKNIKEYSDKEKN